MDSPSARETRAFASEVKFLIPTATGLAIREWARKHLERDPHGVGAFGDQYRTSTIYWDTAEYDVFHRRASFGRSKYRVRRYDAADTVFLERKLRRPGMLTKRRTLVEASLLSRLERPDRTSWIGDWFQRRILLRRLRPVCEIGYFRMARAATASSGPIRLTLDERLHVTRIARPLFQTTETAVAIAEGCMILELKYRGEAPALFKQLVEEFRLEPQATSKYRLGIEAVDPDGTALSATEPVEGAPAMVSRPLQPS